MLWNKSSFVVSVHKETRLLIGVRFGHKILAQTSLIEWVSDIQDIMCALVGTRDLQSEVPGFFKPRDTHTKAQSN
jgi:hypothetical protein